MSQVMLRDGRVIDVKEIIARGNVARWMVYEHPELGDVLVPMSLFGMWL